MLLKRFIAASAICLIVIASFVLPYTAVPVFAETETQEEFYEIGSDSKSLAAAIQAYINARNVWFLSDNSKAFISWVTNEIENDQEDLAILSHNIFSTINRINPVTGTILKFQYKTNAISILNKYFNIWRNKYGLNTQEGKTANVYSGEVFTDADGNTCLVYNLHTNSTSGNVNTSDIEIGTNLKYSKDYIRNLTQDEEFSFHLKDNLHLNKHVYVVTNFGSRQLDYAHVGNNPNEYSFGSMLYLYSNSLSTTFGTGGFSVFKFENGTLHFGNVISFSNLPSDWNSQYNGKTYYFTLADINNVNVPSANIDIHTPSYPQDIPDDDVTIEPKDKTTKKPFSINDSFNDYSKVINNYIDNSVTNNTTSIVNPTDEPEEPEEPEPDPTLPDEDGIWSEPNDEGGYNYHWDAPSGLPDFNFTLPVQLERKFPFCMPFDLLAIFTIFNGEPETPTLEGQIHIGYGNWQYVWDLSKLDVDLHDFDSVMEKVRSVERLGFLIALTFLTMRLFSTAY